MLYLFDHILLNWVNFQLSSFNKKKKSDKDKVVLYDRWPLKRGSIDIKFSKTGQEKVTFRRWLLNRGDCMVRFECNDLIFMPT